MGDVSDKEFAAISGWLYQCTGIFLGERKKTLVSGRLNKRLRQLGLHSYTDYAKLLLNGNNSQEQQVAINLLTTNETYFFREPQHFSFLQQRILAPHPRTQELKIWSAASSSGQEAYSIALLLANTLGLSGNWQILGTDINSEVLSIAERAIYPMQAAERIAPEYLKKYCQKGKGKDQGWFRISAELRNKVSFQKFNLMGNSPLNIQFDIVFLRNVLIYFELADKQKIVQKVIQQLKPGGWLLVGHSESIHGYDSRLVQQQAGCYRLTDQ